MKQKLLSVLLVLAMALTMLPTAAFAEETGKTDPVVAGYGFLWNAPTDSTKLAANGKVGNDWMKETMYVVFEEAVPQNTNLWFQVTLSKDSTSEIWGCAATGSGQSTTYAFSFLNRTGQWEQKPQSVTETENVNEYLKGGETATLKVFKTTDKLTSAPTDTTGFTELLSEEITLTKGTDVSKEVEASTTPSAPAVTITAADVILGNFNAALTGDKVPYTGTPSLGTPTFADATQTTPITITVAPTVADLKTHPTSGTTATDNDKPWVGIGIPQPENGVTVKYYTGWGDAPLNNLGTAGNPDNTQVSSSKTYDTFYWGVTEAHKTAGDKGYLVAVYSADTKADVTVLYVLDFKNVTLASGTTDPDAPTLTVAAVTGEVDLLGKKAADLQSDIKVVNNSKGIKVTGTSKYVTGYTGWSSVAEDQEGNYIALKLTTDSKEDIQFKSVDGTDNGYKTLDSDGILIWRISKDKDGKVKPIEVKVGKDNFTIDLSGVTLLPKAAEGTKVEATTDAEGNTTIKASDTAGNVTVTLPAETAEGLTGNTVKVENKTSFKDVTFADGTASTVTDVVKTASAGAAVTVTDSNGDEVEITGEAAITITIKVTEAGTYHVFCIDNDGKVTSFGEYTADATTKTLTIKSKHLSQYPAVKITEENKAAVDAAAKAAGQDAGKVDGDTPVTPPTTTSTYTRSKDAALNKVTISGKADTYYIVQATNAKNSAPGLIYCVKADGSGKAEVRCNASSVLLVQEGTTTEPVFTNGIPSGLTEVKEATKG